jgi:P pilus assembly chaperone PapD
MPFLNRLAVALFALAIVDAVPANASIVLSQVVVDFAADGKLAQDIEVSNDKKEVSYVAIEPFEIVAPGTPEERRIAIVDPEVGGLLVTPQRLILQPGERRTVRIAAIGTRRANDRVYRVTIKPVAGPVTSSVSAIKLLVGYDVLVIQRPANPAARIIGTRGGETLTLRNDGNTNAELYDGKLCVGSDCHAIPSKRLYAGQSWSQPIGPGKITYRVSTGTTSEVVEY